LLRDSPPLRRGIPDKRIVTDGKLYGIAGEFVTDCRYLNVKGVREAINSEAAIVQRKKGFGYRAPALALRNPKLRGKAPKLLDETSPLVSLRKA